MNNQKEFLSIKEAIQHTGKSDSTIRRMIKKMTSQSHSQNIIKKDKKLYIKREYIISRLGQNEHLPTLSNKNKSIKERQQTSNEYLTKQIDQLEEEKRQWNEEKIMLHRERIMLHQERQEIEKSLKTAMKEILRISKIALKKKKKKKGR